VCVGGDCRASHSCSHIGMRMTHMLGLHHKMMRVGHCGHDQWCHIHEHNTSMCSIVVQVNGLTDYTMHQPAAASADRTFREALMERKRC
jgi:hypothetical protein